MPFWNRKKAEPEPPADWTIPRDARVPARAETHRPSPIPQHESMQAVTFHDNGDVSLNVSSVTEAKLAIKQLRLRKKELGVEKKQISTELATIKAERRQKVGN